MKTILVPTDFSPQAENALLAAHQIAKQWKASLLLLHVIEYPLGLQEYPISRAFPEPLEYLQKAKEEALEFMRKEVRKHHINDVAVIYTTQIGMPYQHINRELMHQKADLVVMGSKGASGMKEILIGSNAERMVRFAHCPVVVIKERTDMSHIDHILWAVTLQNEESHVVQHLRTFQQIYGAHLHLLRVNTTANFLDDPYVKNELRHFAETHQLENYTIHTCSDVGEEEGIIHFADEIDADLIALATHGRRGIAHLLSGSITENIVNHAQRPIWTMSFRKQE